MSNQDLATVGKQLGNLPNAQSFLTRALEIDDEKVYRPEHRALVASYCNLAMVEKDTGSLGKAGSRLKLTIAIEDWAYIPDHFTLAAS